MLELKNIIAVFCRVGNVFL